MPHVSLHEQKGGLPPIPADLAPNCGCTELELPALLDFTYGVRFIIPSVREEVYLLKKWKKALVLFGQFFQFGCFTFGGGWSIIAQIQKLYVEKEKTITSQELLDITSVGRSLPGTMIGNGAMLYGYRVGGIFCGAVCVIAMVLPPMIVLSFITYFYTLFKENIWVMSAMTGVRAAIAPIIASAALGMVSSSFRFPPCFLLAAVSFGLYLFFHVSCVILVIIGIISGILICEYYEKKGVNRRDSDAS